MTRVRVTAPAVLARPTGRLPRHSATPREAAEESDVGQVFVRSLIRSQLRLALVVAGGFLLILLRLPAAARCWSPGWRNPRIAGIPFDWLLLGAGIYPVIGLSAWLYIRSAARNEARYRDLAEDK